MPKTTRVLIVDDSPLFRDALTELLSRHSEIEVVGTARDGVEALALLHQLKPDLVTMDVHMPNMNGLEAVERIMSESPVPIVVLTADENSRNQSWCFEALRRGALELRSKPDIDAVYDDTGMAFCEHMLLLARVPVVHHPRKRQVVPTVEPPIPHRPAHIPAVVGIVASTGGPAALAEVLGALPANYPLPIVIVQHLAAGFAPHLAQWLNDSCALEVRVATSGALLLPGVVLLAGETRHLIVEAGGRVALVPDSAEQYCPSGDRLLASLARSFRERAVGVVLTGMGKDGAAGLLKVRRVGGITIAQDGPSSVVDGMPRAARESGAAGEVLPLSRIAPALLHRALTFSLPGGHNRA